MATSQYSPRTLTSYKEVLNTLSSEELRLIPQIKRFFECLSGDAEFRKTLNADPNNPVLRDRLQRIGVEFDPDELTPLWSQTNERLQQYYQWLINPLEDMEQEPEIEIHLEDSPFAKLWMKWRKAYWHVYRKYLSQLLSISKNSRFDAWRQRRIASAKGELGPFGHYIDHPIFAFELSKGCSIGCWFCGFSARKLSAIFDYTPKNRTLWREMVKIGVDMFGIPAGMALCYYGTEPYDNPHYLDFLKDYQEISGATLCTATAAPLKDSEWLRSLIAFYREGTHPWPRLSVLSVSMLRQIHETYTPDELRDVELLMQMKNAPRMKATSGRILHAEKEKLGGVKIPDEAPFIPQGSIACVSGFLINMVDRTIQLISPCYASEQWPYGYRVFAEEKFQDASDYRAILEHIIETQITEHLFPEMVLAFRDDLQYSSTSEGFMLLSPNKRHHLRGKTFHKQLGELIAQGDKTYREIVDILTDTEASVFDVSRIITKLFDRGLLDESQIGHPTSNFRERFKSSYAASPLISLISRTNL